MKKEDEFYLENTEFGCIKVSTVKMPEDVYSLEKGIFTYSGKILLIYKTKDNCKVKDYYKLTLIDADGTGYKNIFEGIIPQHKKANGIRFMPFQDNKRLLLGDYVMEFTPSIDNCEKAEVIPLIYPGNIEALPNVLQSWTEVIVAPDNEHIAWSTIHNSLGSINFVGKLKRLPETYTLENLQIISTLDYFVPDENNESCLRPQIMRGGELKQFINGGLAISAAGSSKAGTIDSVVQELNGHGVHLVTDTCGYEETTIFSPDEKLGIVMSTRFSPRSNCGIFGLVPRPLGVYTTMGLAMAIYNYSVTDVRNGARTGNIGPVLVDIERSMKEENYEGISLQDPEGKWVFRSPMSWNQDGKLVIWNERSLEAEGEVRRLRIAELLDYEPKEIVSIENTPDDIPYAIKGGMEQLQGHTPDFQGKIMGKHSGYINYFKKGKADFQTVVGKVHVEYHNFSEDGEQFWNGEEHLSYTPIGKTIYEADVTMNGKFPGEMKLRTIFTKEGHKTPIRLLKDIGEDGKPLSYGYATYKGITLKVEDMEI